MIYHVNGSQLYTNGYTGWFPIDTKTRYPAYYQDGMNSRFYKGGHGYGKRWAGAYGIDGGDYSDIYNVHESMLNNSYMDSGSYGMRHTTYQTLCNIPTSYTSSYNCLALTGEYSSSESLSSSTSGFSYISLVASVAVVESSFPC